MDGFLSMDRPLHGRFRTIKISTRWTEVDGFMNKRRIRWTVHPWAVHLMDRPPKDSLPHGRIWTTDHDNSWQVDGRTDGPSILWTESDDRPRLFLIDGRTDGQKSVRRGLLPGSKLGCPAFSGGIWDCAYQITHENEIERFKLVYLRIVWSSPGQSGSNRLAKTIVGKIFQSWWCFYFRSVWEKIITLGWRWFFHDFHD